METLGPHCCIPAPPAEHASAGREEVVGAFLSYVVEPSSPSNAAVLLVSDVHGFEAPLFRKLADKIAVSGYFVIAPDFLNKDYRPADPSSMREWLSRHQPIDVVEDTKTLIGILKSKGFKSVGAVGFCWGGKVVAELSKGDSLKAGVFCHPSLVTVDDIKGVKTPLAILGAEIDKGTPPELLKQFQEILDSKEVQNHVKIFPGVTHGWTTRYDIHDENDVARANEAHNDILEWFGKQL